LARCQPEIMQRLPVESSDVVAIGYDAKTRVLEVEFRGNRIYHYFDVEPEVYQRFMRADSYGEFFYAHVNKHYRYRRVEDAPEGKTPSTIALVTGNIDKLRDCQAACRAFGIEVEQLDLPVEEIQSHEPERIITHKAKQAYKLARRPVVVQDTFWNILALRGFPGAYMRYVSEWLRAEDFLALMAGKRERTIIRTHSVAYYDGKRLKLFTKDFSGTITDAPRGKGLAIDQIVLTAGQTRTNAEIREAEGRSSIPPEESAWHEFAKWYHLQRRIATLS
jgi:non-canonical purine NTP pyrophosphatase (RdgB/HAM1 family)